MKSTVLSRPGTRTLHCRFTILSKIKFENTDVNLVIKQMNQHLKVLSNHPFVEILQIVVVVVVVWSRARDETAIKQSASKLKTISHNESCTSILTGQHLLHSDWYCPQLRWDHQSVSKQTATVTKSQLILLPPQSIRMSLGPLNGRLLYEVAKGNTFGLMINK